MTNVAFYIRVSTQEQARHGLSLGDQRAALEDYAREKGYHVVGYYEDAGISARKPYTKRPALLRLLTDCEAGRVDLILFVKLDRWFRSVAGYYQVQDTLDRHHVAWCAIREDYETATASGRLKVNIMLAVAQDEADRISDRIKFVYEGKRDRNEARTNKIPLGYKLVNKHIEIDEEQAKTVRQIFEVYLRRGALSDVFDAFPDLNLNYKMLYTILHSDRYLGHVCGVIAPPIITPELHARALSYRCKAPRRTVDENRVFLFSGLIVCPKCGGAMASTHAYLHNREYIYYRCGKHRRGGNCTCGHCYEEKEIETYMLSHLASAVALASVPVAKSPAPDTSAKRATIERKLTKLSDLYVSDLIGKDDYAAKYKALQAQLAAIPVSLPPKSPPRLPPNWREIYDSLSRKGQQEFWRQTIEKITLNAETVEDFTLR